MKKTEEFKKGFISGQWHAYNEVLGYLNTLEFVMTDKTEIWKHVFSLRPKKEENENENNR